MSESLAQKIRESLRLPVSNASVAQANHEVVANKISEENVTFTFHLLGFFNDL